MDDDNPYKSPLEATPSEAEDRPRFDAGKLTARYLQAIGVLSVLSDTYMFLVHGRLSFYISAVILFWAARHLLKHSRTARMWVIVACIVNMTGVLPCGC